MAGGTQSDAGNERDPSVDRDLAGESPSLGDVHGSAGPADVFPADVDCREVLVRFPAAVLVVPHEGPGVLGNDRAEALTGYAADVMARMSVEQLLSVEGQALDAGALATAWPDEQEGILHRGDGSETSVAFSVAAFASAGRAYSILMIRDIASQQATLAKLRDVSQRMQFHVERMPLAHIVWDTSFRVVDWNPAAERIFGYTKAQALGRHAYELIVPKSVFGAVDKVWAALLQGDTSSHSINVNRRRDESSLTCEWFNTSLRSGDGSIIGVASMAMDVSERAELEERIRDAQKLESLGILASGVSHDFNNALLVILGNAAMLRATAELPRGCLEHLELIEDAGSRANVLVKHLLTYARTGRHNPQTSDLNDVIQQAVPFMQSSLGPQHQLSIALADELPPIHADRGQLEQVAVNLCLNAAQAMVEGGAVRLVTALRVLSPSVAARCVPFGAKAGEYVELCVSDLGCGMDRATISRIFDPFYSTKADGHGLGLAAVLGILRQHDAVAHVESRVGAGTDFHVYFPVAEGSADAAVPPRPD